MCTEHLACVSWQPGVGLIKVGSSGLCPVQPLQPSPLVWYLLLTPVSCKRGRVIGTGSAFQKPRVEHAAETQKDDFHGFHTTINCLSFAGIKRNCFLIADFSVRG